MKKEIIVIGAGLGGVSAAIMLAQRGYQVTVFEKNGHVGGKLNLLKTQGFSFDLGPSIFTLPQMFRPLFDHGNRRMEDYLDLKRVDPQWRNFFEDGTVLNLWEKPERMQSELSRFGPHTWEEYCEFLKYSRQQYRILERGYFRKGLDNFWQFLQFYGLRDARDLDYSRTMSGSIYQRLSNAYLRDIFEYFIKYVGSSALDSPGFMNLMPNIQLEFGLWYISGGLYQLAHALNCRMKELGVTVCLEHTVEQIQTKKSVAVGIQYRDPSGDLHTLTADYVISNMEVIPAMRRLLKVPSHVMKRLQRFEPACSGIVLHLGLDRIYPQLAHHNFFFSRDQHAHFHRVFRKKQLPDDPTIYLVAPTRTDPSQAPAGCDNLKILPHIPHLDERRPYSSSDYAALKNICLDKLERMGLKDLRKHIIVEDFWTPLDIERRYLSNCGSIYGVVCDRRKNFAFKAPRKSSRYKNLYFVGGSVNPGGGMPMVVLSGQHVADAIAKEDGLAS
ncbi:phytoene desaturase family protein [Pseudacidobacterium ailaaui]|jgi:diapolycopene oxygenase|uniref:phytoene desaturase family protein n=1 Tax=Pseudacidobacterium ailaaui TaxID=1382359 RepID=UPI00047CA75C|nr:phytoene desaturase family protein [Pseudacidobacterium ailaaui]MBX6361340.1 phytoene desaturase [Pseudacidobacterium ailaaui]